MCMKKKRDNKEEGKIRTNVTLSREIFNLAVDYNLNLSSFLENKLVEYFLQRKQLSGMYCIASDTQPYTPNTHVKQQRQSQNVTTNTSPQQEECGRRDLNPSFKLGKLK
jgi:hypothetical protein